VKQNGRQRRHKCTELEPLTNTGRAVQELHRRSVNAGGEASRPLKPQLYALAAAPAFLRQFHPLWTPWPEKRNEISTRIYRTAVDSPPSKEPHHA
jgi:hypothetical protein